MHTVMPMPTGWSTFPAREAVKESTLRLESDLVIIKQWTENVVFTFWYVALCVSSVSQC